jgi:hypothetical protein
VSYGEASKTVWFRLPTRSTAPLGAPRIPGVEHLVRLGPAWSGLYDVFEATPDHWRFTLGGGGPEASAALARDGLRLLAADDIADAVTRLNQALVREAAGPMSLVHGELTRNRTTGMRVTLVSAGHPPPLRLTTDGEVTAPTPAQAPLGAANETRFKAGVVDLERGDALLCVSRTRADGLGEGASRQDALAGLGERRGGPRGEPAVAHQRCAGNLAVLLLRVL